jgi:hypothetical protein
MPEYRGRPASIEADVARQHISWRLPGCRVQGAIMVARAGRLALER